MRRDPLPVLALLAILGALVFATLLTRLPELAIWDDAERLPVAGEWIAETRARFLPPPERPRTVREERTAREEPTRSVETITIERTVAPLPPWDGTPEYVWALEGTPIYDAPSADATILETTEAITNLPRLERRGDWFRVWRHGAEAWVRLPGYREDGGPPFGEAIDPPRPLAPRDPDPEKLAAVREVLGDRARVATLGPYRLLTDLEATPPNERLLRFLDRVAGQVDAVYAARYGREPIGTPGAIVALFTRESDYRRLQESVEGLEGLSSAVGHASGGVAALFVGDRQRHAVASTLVHELTHLVNRRAIGPALPPWLDEGLSDDLANSRFALDGTLDPKRLGGARLDWPDATHFEGAHASLQALRDAERADRRPSVAEVLVLDREGFVKSERSRQHYDVASFFLRHLLDEPGRRAALHEFLDAVAAGEPADPEALRRRLDEPWPAIDNAFGRWLVEAARQNESP